jgi:hypothetical protein
MTEAHGTFEGNYHGTATGPFNQGMAEGQIEFSLAAGALANPLAIANHTPALAAGNLS